VPASFLSVYETFWTDSIIFDHVRSGRSRYDGGRVFRIGLIVLLGMLALLIGAGGTRPLPAPALGSVASGRAAVWVCHPGGRCLHMMLRP
jgi:hypothetical protein